MTARTVVQSAPNVNPSAGFSMGWHPDKPWLAVASADRVSVWKDDCTVLSSSYRRHASFAAFDEDGELVWIAGGRLVGSDPFDHEPRWSVEVGSFSAARLAEGRWVFGTRQGATPKGLAVYHRGSATVEAFADVSAHALHGNGTVVLAIGRVRGEGPRFWVFGADGAPLFDQPCSESPLRTEGFALHPTEAVVGATVGDWQTGDVVLWDGTGEVARLEGAAIAEGFRAQGLSFLPGGEKVLVVGSDRAVIWNFRSGTVEANAVADPKLEVARLATVRPDGAVGAYVGPQIIRFFDLGLDDASFAQRKTCKSAFQVARSVGAGNGCAAVGFGSTAAIFGRDGLTHYVKKCARDVAHLGLVPGRNQLVTRGSESGLFVHDLGSEARIEVIGCVAEAGDGTSVATNGRSYAVGDGKRVQREVVLQAPPAKPRKRDGLTDDDRTVFGIPSVSVHSSSVRIAATPSREIHAVGAAGVSLYRRDGTLIRELEVDGSVVGLELSPSGDRLAVGTSGALAVFTVEDDGEPVTLAEWGPSVHGRNFAFVTEEVLIYLGGDGVARLWNTRTDARLSLHAASAKKWVAIDDQGRCAGTKSGLGAVRRVTGGDAPKVAKLKAPDDGVLESFFDN